MKYFNYHAKIKKMISNGMLISYEFVDEYHGIRPALVLHFSNNVTMPIREYRWEEYIPFLMELNDTIEIKDDK